jgi:hypothetical protein
MKSYPRSWRTKHLFISAVLLSVAILTAPSWCGAQTNLATLRGTVSDPSGATVPNATVVVTNVAMNVSRKVDTNAAGDYEIPYLVPGTYQLTCSATGFQRFVAQEIALVGYETRRIDIHMHVGTASTQVTVTAGAAVISTEGAQISGGFTENTYRDSPESGATYNPASQMIMVPMVQSQAGSYALQVAGLAPTQISESMDGVETDCANNLVNNTHNIQDLEVIAVNAPAEFSRAVNLTLSGKSGGNKFHGVATFDELNSSLNARFTLNATKPKIKTHEGYAELAGPLKKDRTFFYLAYTLARVPGNTFYNATVPDNLERLGNFSELSKPVINPYTGVQFPGNIINIPLSTVTTKEQQLYIPTSNQGSGGIVANNFGFIFPYSPTWYKFDMWNVRVDHSFSSKHQLFGREILRISPYVLVGSFPNVGQWTRNRFDDSRFVSDTYTFSPSLVNNARFGWDLDHVSDGITELGFTPVTGDVAVSAIGLQGVNPNGYKIMGFPNTSITGVSSLSQQPGGKTLDTNAYAYTDSLTWAKGRHVAKFGGQIRHWSNPTMQYASGTYGSFSYDGRFTGTAYADFLLGLPATSTRLNPLVNRSSHANEQGYYAEDTFKITSKFTLNYGLRWEYFGFPTYSDGLVYNWDPTSGNVIVPQASLTKIDPLYPTSTIKVVAGPAVSSADSKLFRPRIGAAYRLSDRFVIRGGYGMYTQALGAANNGPPISQSLLTSPAPFKISESYSNAQVNGAPLLTMPSPFPATLSSSVVPGQSVTGYPSNITNGIIHEFSVSVERQVRSVGLSMSYVGDRGRGMNYMVGQTDIPQPSTTAFTSSAKPFPQFVGTSFYMSNGSSKYDALLLEAKRRLGHFSFDANYTYANSMANYLDTEDVYSLLHWNHDQYTARSRMVAQVTYDLPFGRGQRWGSAIPGAANAVLGGWHLNWVSTFQGGQYFTPSFSGSDPSHTNTFGGIPNRICSGNLSGSQRSTSKWFDATCFAVPQSGRFGNSGVNILEGPPNNDTDITLSKDFRVKEQVRINFAGLFLDAFNTPVYAFPYANISTSSTVGHLYAGLGGITAGGNGVDRGGERNIILRLRIEF